MSGHSKWSKIKRQKQAGDVNRSLVFSKLANAITLAVRQGGTIADPTSNFKLRLAVEKAKAANMPKDNIARAIERGKGEDDNGMEEIIYEGFGPDGTALIVEAATDNKLRTLQSLKNILERHGGILAGKGATSYLFQKNGLIQVDYGSFSLDQIMDMAVGVGAIDIQEGEHGVEIYTTPDQLHEIGEKLQKLGLPIREIELVYRPITSVPIQDVEVASQIIKIVNQLEDNPDVQKVSSNVDLPQAVMDSHLSSAQK